MRRPQSSKHGIPVKTSLHGPGSAGLPSLGTGLSGQRPQPNKDGRIATTLEWARRLTAADIKLLTGQAAYSEKVPDPELRPHGFTIEKGGLLDLEEAADQLVACGYERLDQVEDRGQFAIRGDILDVYPATEERAVRCELFDVEVERLTFFSTFTQRSLEEADAVEIAPAAELAPEHRER